MLVLDRVADANGGGFTIVQKVEVRTRIELDLVGDNAGAALASRSAGRGDSQYRAGVDVGVVVEDVDQQRHVLGRGVAVGVGDRAVVDPGQCNGDRLCIFTTLAVVDGHGVGLGPRLALGERLQIGVVDVEAPVDLARAVAGGVIADDGVEGAEIAGVVGGDGNRVGVGEVDVTECKASDFLIVASVFRHRAGNRAAADHDPVVDAGDGHLDGLDSLAAFAVVDGDGVALGEDIADAEMLDGGVVDVEAPVDLARAVAGGIVADDGVEGAEIAGVVRGDGDRVGVAEVDIGESEAADRLGRERILGDRAGDRAVGSDYHAVIGASIGDGDSCPGEGAVGEPDGIGKRIVQRIADAEGIDRILERRRKRIGIVADLAGIDPDLRTGRTVVVTGYRILTDIGLDQVQCAVGIGGGVVQRPQDFGVAAKIVQHDVEEEDAHVVFRFVENVALRLRRVHQRRGRAAASVRSHVHYPRTRPVSDSERD